MLQHRTFGHKIVEPRTLEHRISEPRAKINCRSNRTLNIAI